MSAFTSTQFEVDHNIFNEPRKSILTKTKIDEINLSNSGMTVHRQS